jgi:hypothetical protein
MAPKTQREREAEQRQAKLDRIQEQVSEGSLVIRKMTDAERRAFSSARDDRPAPQATPAQRRRAARARAKNERRRVRS